MKFRSVSFPLSAILSIATVILFFAVGMNFGIDFKGGTLVELQAKGTQANISDVRERSNNLGFGSVEVAEFGSPRELLLRIELQVAPTVAEQERAQQNVVTKLREAFGAEYEFRRVEVVGPRVSGELVQSGAIGVIVAVIGVLLYLWFRFEWQFAVGAVIATLHDIVLTIGFFLVMQLTFDMTSIAVVLTILGYSLNDTVVIYDRIREMLRKYKKLSLYQVLDISVNATLSRTVITATTTFLAMTAMAIFGGEVLRSFSLAMLFGIVIGTYSSIFIAAPVLIYLGLKTGGGDPARGEQAAEAKAVAAPVKA
ncbi:MAG: protein translocase subunit SecF [Bosea sp.]|nr:protein translocase subunit SecF [Bosea sp. (in: a-proteobacteria)]